MPLLETILHKFYAAHISFDLNGGMLVASSRDRIMAWGMIFCFIAALSLITLLISRKQPVRYLALTTLALALTIPAFVIPSVKREYIHVSPQQIVIDTGTWYRPSTTTLNVAQLSHIVEETDGILPANLIGDPDIIWHFNQRNGTREQLRLNDFFSAHRMVIAYYYTDRGYVIRPALK